jgi:hypothetical protein
MMAGTFLPAEGIYYMPAPGKLRHNSRGLSHSNWLQSACQIE